MKKNKSMKSKKIIFATLLMVAIGTIILGIFFSNKVTATGKCTQCGTSQVTVTATATGCIITCQDQSCNRYNMPITIDHTWGTPVCTPQSKRYTSKRNSMYSMWLCKNRNCN